MSNDARRLLTEEARARAVVAIHRGGMCARCGRELADEELGWLARVAVQAGGASHWHVVVGRECVSEGVRRRTEGTRPQACAGCGRGVYRGSVPARGRPMICSERCRRRYRVARTAELPS